MSNLGKILLEAAQLLSEGAVKTSKKYKLDKYLKKYGFEGDKKSGTITVNGKKIEVDRDTKSKTMTLANGDIKARSTGMDNSSSRDRIVIGKDFEKLKNNKRRDAVLNHEIGHIKYHNNNKPSNDSNDINSITGRYEARKNFNKYNVDNTHANVNEFEADAYASQNKNGDHLKRAIRDTYKIKRKDIANSIKSNFAAVNLENDKYIDKLSESELDKHLIDKKIQIKDLSLDDKKNKFKKICREENNIELVNKLNNKESILKKRNIKNETDYNKRQQAIKDKSIDKRVYRESVELLLIEAIDLLSAK